MGTGVLDSVSGNQVYFPETKGPTTSDDVERAMNDLNAGTQTAQAQKPNWVQSNIIDPIVKTAKQYNIDPVMGVKAFGAGFFKAEGLGQLIGAPAKYPAQDPNNATPFASTVQNQPRMPTPTVPEQEMYRAKAPLAYLAGQFGGVGTDFAIANLATDGLAGIAGPVLAKVPMIQKFLQGINTMKEAGTLSEQGVALGAAAAKTPLTWGAVGATESIASQEQSEGKIDWGQAFKDFAVSTGMGVATEGVFGFMSKPLSDIGSTQELMANTGKKMLAAGAVAGAIVASGGGSPKETAFAGGLGVLLGGLTLHGDIEGVKESIMAEHLNLKARYIVSQTGEDPSSAYQKATEQTMNDAEQIINESNQKAMEAKPVAQDQRQPAKKAFSDPYDPELFNHLSQFFSPKILTRMDGEYRLWLGNQPMKDLNAWADQQKELDWEKAIQDDYLQKSRSEIIEDDARRARGIAVDKTVLDEVSSSKELTANLVAKTLNEVTTTRGEVLGNTKERLGVQGEKEENKIPVIVQGEENANKSGTQTTGRGTQEGVNRKEGTGLRVRNNDASGSINKETEGKVGISKAAKNINAQFAKEGVSEIPEEELANYTKEQRSVLEDKVLEILSNPERLDRVLSGEEKLDKNEAQAVSVGAEKIADANKDNDLLRKVASSSILTRASEIAQELQSRKVFGYTARDSGVKLVRDTNKDLEKEITPEKQEKIKKTFTQLREKARKLQKEEMLKNIKNSMDDILNKAAC